MLNQHHMKCIYCKIDKEAGAYMNREHVVPESFGRFRDNLVLHSKVCDECNQFFGDSLEIRLARDTYEGLQRFTAGVKKPKDYRSSGRRSTLIIRMQEGPFKNAYAYLEYSADNDQLRLKPVEQIGFLRKDNLEYDFFPYNDFPSRQDLGLASYDLQNDRAFIVPSGDLERAKELLGSIGLSFKEQGEVIDQRDGVENLLVEVTSTLDQTIKRCIAKIAFNYLAYWNETPVLLRSV